MTKNYTSKNNISNIPNDFKDDIKLRDKHIYSNNTKYEFTFNPKEQYQHSGKKRLHQVFSLTSEHLQTYLKPYANYKLQTEISMPCMFLPDTLPRYHYHGYASFIRVHQFLAESASLLCQHGTFTFYPVRDEWDAYINKQRSLMDCEYSAFKYIIDSDNVSIKQETEVEHLTRELLNANLPKLKTKMVKKSYFETPIIKK